MSRKVPKSVLNYTLGRHTIRSWRQNLLIIIKTSWGCAWVKLPNFTFGLTEPKLSFSFSYKVLGTYDILYPPKTFLSRKNLGPNSPRFFKTKSLVMNFDHEQKCCPEINLTVTIHVRYIRLYTVIVIPYQGGEIYSGMSIQISEGIGA